jgi:hypothetical protein
MKQRKVYMCRAGSAGETGLHIRFEDKTRKHRSHLGFLRTTMADRSTLKMGAIILQGRRGAELDEVREELWV